MFLYAHRGASAEAPENTLAAFRRALEAGADGVELDVHLSADGVPVVIHDDTVERTTDGAGPVAFFAAESLRELDAGGWFAPEFAGEPLPTLEETLHLLAGKLRINIEVKESRAGMAVVNLLRHLPTADVVVSSFDHDLLDDLRRTAPGLPLAVLFDEENWHRVLARAVSLRASAVHPRADLVSRPLVAACHRCQLPVHVWTVDAPARARSLARMGVDGLFTNDPATLRGQLPG